jgi:hypothetical protein
VPSGLTSSATILSIGQFSLTIFSIPAVIILILLIKSKDEDVIHPDLINNPSSKIAHPELFVDKSKLSNFIFNTFFSLLTLYKKFLYNAIF